MFVALVILCVYAAIVFFTKPQTDAASTGDAGSERR
jgi:hypothetical protein